MDDDLLYKAGVALYGSSWMSDLADTLGVDADTVQAWRDGDEDAPDNLAVSLYAIATNHMLFLRAILPEIGRATLDVRVDNGQRPPAVNHD